MNDALAKIHSIVDDLRKKVALGNKIYLSHFKELLSLRDRLDKANFRRRAMHGEVLSVIVVVEYHLSVLRKLLARNPDEKIADAVSVVQKEIVSAKLEAAEELEEIRKARENVESWSHGGPLDGAALDIAEKRSEICRKLYRKVAILIHEDAGARLPQDAVTSLMAEADTCRKALDVEGMETLVERATRLRLASDEEHHEIPDPEAELERVRASTGKLQDEIKTVTAKLSLVESRDEKRTAQELQGRASMLVEERLEQVGLVASRWDVPTEEIMKVLEKVRP